MGYYLYQARLNRSKSHPEWLKFMEECDSLRAHYPGYGGFDGLALISSSQNLDTIESLLVSAIGKKYKSDVTVEEITTNTMYHGNDLYLRSDIIYLEKYHKYDNIDTSYDFNQE